MGNQSAERTKGKPRSDIGPAPERRRTGRWEVAALVLLVVVLLQQAGGFANLLDKRVVGADYIDAARYIADRHAPGEPVIVALPPPAYLAFQSTDDLTFLPGTIDTQRAQRYTRQLSDGRYVDFWLGIPAIVTVSALCQELASVPAPWLIVDDDRLSWAYGGALADVILAMTVEVYRDDGGVAVRRAISAELWPSNASTLCEGPAPSEPVAP